MKIEIKIISARDEEYKEAMRLITEVLHAPFGIPPYVIMPGNEDNLCFLAYNGKKLVGCNVAYIEGNLMEGRQIAVRASAQKLGIGSMLMTFAENYAKQKGVKEIHFNARTTSVEFHKKHGFKCVGDPCIRNIRGVDIQFVKMRKEI